MVARNLNVEFQIVEKTTKIIEKLTILTNFRRPLFDSQSNGGPHSSSQVKAAKQKNT
jgi:hypothetical protein